MILTFARDSQMSHPDSPTLAAFEREGEVSEERVEESVEEEVSEEGRGVVSVGRERVEVVVVWHASEENPFRDLQKVVEPRAMQTVEGWTPLTRRMMICCTT